MNSLHDPYTFILACVVISFWSVAALLSRVHHRTVSPGLLVLPAFFILIGVTINLYYPRWGTYMIALIHVIMLPALLKVARRKP